MDRSASLALVAGEIRHVVDRCMALERRLEDLQRVNLASELFDIELQLIQLHSKLLESASQPTAREHSARRLDQPELPF